jgi:hypothetical protein
MMKKLLVLVLVLGISSVASAVGTVDLVISSVYPASETPPPAGGGGIDPVKEITIAPSEWVNLDIIYHPDPTAGNPPLNQLSVTITLEGLATLDTSLYTEPAGVWCSMFSTGITEVVPGSVHTAEFTAGFTGTGLDDGIALDHILVHCDSDMPLGNQVTVTITDYVVGSVGCQEGVPGSGNYTIPEVIGSVTITQIPEPMTLALLGLGGLFFVRRRK